MEIALAVLQVVTLLRDSLELIQIQTQCLSAVDLITLLQVGLLVSILHFLAHQMFLIKVPVSIEVY
nr:MAG TPA: hypothetical protein [Caudoviricetes sp.]